MVGGEGLNFDGLAPKPVPKQTQRVTKDTPLLSWRGQSFERGNLDFKWLILLSGLIIALIGYSIWQKDWFVVVIIIIVTAVTLWYLKTVKPKELVYTITPIGIYEGERFYSFAEIHSFWLVYNKNVQKLFLAFDKKYLPALTIIVKEVDPVLLRSILLKKIPEQSKRPESVVDKMIRIFGL